MTRSELSFRSFRGAILLFIILFLLTLTNSIFLNQLGYYGALVLLLVQWYKEKQNPFTRNGLEVYFLLFLAVELISAIDSVNRPQAFNNLLKRALLIPLVYVFAAAPRNEKDVKDIIHIYLFAAIAVTLVYLGASYRYVALNLYQITESGPDLFQYPITTSELLIFAIVLCFALFFHSKAERKLRILYFAGFVISVLGLLATFKRTGLLGAAVGIFVVLFLSNRKLALIPVILLGAFIPFAGKNTSNITLLQIKPGGKAEVIKTIPTGGRASWSETDRKGNIYIADYEGGLLQLEGDSLISKIKPSSPVQRLFIANDTSVIAWLADSRFVVYKEGQKFNEDAGFLSPGLTSDARLNNNTLALLDKDSGLTIYNVKDSLLAPTRVAPQGANERVYLFDSTFVIIGKQGGLFYYSSPLIRPELINKEVKYSFSASAGDKLLLSTGENLLVASFRNGVYTELGKINGIKHPAGWCTDSRNGRLYLYTLEGEIHRIDSQLTSSELLTTLSFQPRSVSAKGDTLIVTGYTRSRLSSFTDPYNPSNLSRVALWRAGLQINKDYPWFGVGDIDLGRLFKQYKREYDKEIQGHMHNNYIHFLVILGRIGLAVVLLLFVNIFYRSYKALQRVRGNRFAESYIIGFTGAFAAFLTAGLTEWNFGDHEIITMVWFTLGLVFALQRMNENKH